MGRRENAVAAETRQAEALALWLRAQRERRGLTYAAMALLTGHQFTASALSRGASGRTVPSRRLVVSFAAACEADPDEAVRLWKAARRAREERRRQAGISPEFRDLATSVRSVMTHPDVVDSFGKLHDVMVEMRARKGQPSLNELQTMAGRTRDGRHRLPKSSLSLILRGEAVPSREHLTAFMESLEVPPNGVRRWQQVWDRISRAERPPAAASKMTFPVDAPRGESPARADAAFHVLEDETTLDFRRGQISLKTMFATGPRGQHGPRKAHPPAGTTRSGLPVRTPYRYPVLVRAGGSPTVGILTLQPKEAPLELPPEARSPLSVAPQVQVETSAVPPARSPRPAVLRSFGRAIERWRPKSAASDHTRWPNF
ncbi:helix-turn-helix domain-containing protein [Streptomyces sp. NPDC059651]|uniref:helix-turn-helix domain-containing protein n=1 Tax=Streptomyces sp. NPDC059651 TaxID=3346897 RepID=UPI0036857101